MTTKVCIINCHKQPDYVRAKVFRHSVGLIDGAEVLVVKNSHQGLLKYSDVIFKTLWLRLTKRPDIYILTFRGYEVLPFIRLITVGKKLIYDEFINPIEWIAYEHKKFSPDGSVIKLVKFYYRQLLKTVNLILTDTEAHSKFSSKIMDIPLSKYAVIPVGTDEAVFHPVKSSQKRSKFQVFYYGNMLPLHGLRFVLEAAKILQTEADINFLIVGGDAETRQNIESAKVAGAKIEHKDWLPFEELPKTMHNASLCLGGPFGNTVQGRMVITGKTYQMLAMGVPVLIGEVDEKTPFEDQTNCIIAKQGSAQDLANKILWAYEHKSKLDKIGQQGRQLYEDNYSNKIISQQLSEVIN